MCVTRFTRDGHARTGARIRSAGDSAATAATEAPKCHAFGHVLVAARAGPVGLRPTGPGVPLSCRVPGYRRVRATPV